MRPKTNWGLVELTAANHKDDEMKEIASALIDIKEWIENDAAAMMIAIGKIEYKLDFLKKRRSDLLPKEND